MNLYDYDETIYILKEFGKIEVHEDDGVIEEYWLIGETYPIQEAIKVLEHAKKVSKLLELYKEKDYPVGTNYDERHQRYQEIIRQIKTLEELNLWPLKKH